MVSHVQGCPSVENLFSLGDSDSSVNAGGAVDVSTAHGRGAARPLLKGRVKCQRGISKVNDWDGSVGLDWIQGTIPLHKIFPIRSYLDEVCGVKGESKDFGHFRYDRSVVWEPFGITLYYDSSTERALHYHNERALVVFPGHAVNCFDAVGLHTLCKDLSYDFWFICTRFDVKFDDYTRFKCPRDLEVEADKDNFSGPRVYEMRKSRKRGGDFSGEMITFGKRGSDGSGQYLRCYDKNLESKGEIDSIRWEVEFSSERARLGFFGLSKCLSIEEFATRCGALVGGSIDFIDREAKPNERHLDRHSRLDWWQRIIDVIGRCKLSNPKRIRTVGKAVEWVESSVSVSLAMVRSSLGEDEFWDWLEAVLDTGEGRLKPYHEKVIEEYRKLTGVPEDVRRGHIEHMEVPF